MKIERDAGGFSPMVMIVLVLVGVVSLAGIGVLSAYEPDLRSGDNGQEHALSRSAVGFAALARLLGKAGTPVVLSRGALSPAAQEGLLVLTPGPGGQSVRVGDFEHGGPVLIVLPKWRISPDPLRRGWVRTFGTHDVDMVLGVLPKNSGLTLQRRPGTVAVRLFRPDGRLFAGGAGVEELQTLSGQGWVPVLKDERGGVVMAMRADGGFYVLSDPDLLNTQALKTLSGARGAIDLLALIRAQDTPVVFDLTLHGFKRSLNPLRLLLEPPLLGVTLCLALALVLVGVQAATRFGPARAATRAVALGKRALADNSAGLVRLARRENRIAAPYADLVRADVARAVGAPRGLDGPDLDNLLDRLSAVDGEPRRYSTLAERARAARTPSDLMEVARQLFAWKLEMTRERR